MQLFLYYLSYLYFLAMPLALWLIWRKPSWHRGIVLGGFCVGISVLAYARFVEPRILLTRSHDLEICTGVGAGTFRLALFSDTHNGIFGNAMPVRRIVDRVNALAPDFVMIPGDFTYNPAPEELPGLFAALSGLEVPAFAVLGNHDVGVNGEDLTAPLVEVLDDNGLIVLDGATAQIEVNGSVIDIIGLADHWGAEKDNDWFVPETPAGGDFILALEHNPEILRDRRDIPEFDLLVSGHTHGGQVYIPWLTCKWMKLACNVHRYGYLEHWRGNLFVTSGTGMVGLPLRFNMPPRVDVLNVSYAPCGKQ